MQNPEPIRGAAAPHYDWVDIVRGMAILWIVYFHSFIAYGGKYPWLMGIGTYGGFIEQCAPDSAIQHLLCTLEALFAGFFQRGSQGVGVFVLFSGFGRTYSLVKKREDKPAWMQWYRRRLFRLFPIYWVAHLLLLLSPFQYNPDPVDYRFFLSFLGDRIYPIQMFFYFVPSWWFFGLLLELYIAFPFLYRAMLRFGAGKFMVFCIIAAALSRYFLFAIVQADGNWIQGAFFACRLWEFAAGMVLGKLLAEHPEAVIRFLSSPGSLLLGAFTYVLGLYSYQPNFLYSFTDGLNGVGLSAVMIHLAFLAARLPGIGRVLAKTGTYSYGLYLFHQPLVMYAGDKLRDHNIGVFILGASIVITVVTLGSICIEFGMNKVLSRSRTN
ncbi:MAG: acyltransferase [Syntrophobacteraceae bacterium]